MHRYLSYELVASQQRSSILRFHKPTFEHQVQHRFSAAQFWYLSCLSTGIELLELLLRLLTGQLPYVAINRAAIDCLVQHHFSWFWYRSFLFIGFERLKLRLCHLQTFFHQMPH
mmetsp:Transcript_4399/g.9926  ORF Transcript_4399/g.9926 Transcript_4399/m.9926 type:complete len:114 (+) Transcript_4399:103-444(+)